MEVFFDDFSVYLTDTDIVQKDDYYPFGGSFNAYTDLSTPQQDYLYNGVRRNKTTQLYETAFRTYDPYLGRFNHIDPLAAMVPGLSPYHFGFNNPVRYSDPLGLMGDDAGIWGTGNAYGSYANGTKKNPWGYSTGPGSGHHWSDGIGYSDWSMWGGSEMYKDALASGAIEYGGMFYNIDGDGKRGKPYEERNGRLGYWVDYNTTTVSGNYKTGQTISAERSQWVNVESNGGEFNLRFHSSFSWVNDGHIRTEGGDFGGLAGQHVRVEITNMNLGVQLRLQDQSRYSFEKTLFGFSERKVYHGSLHTFNLLPGQTKTFDFYRFDHSPMIWQFGLSKAEINEVVNLRIRIYSNWVPGDPIFPNHPFIK